MDHGDCIDEPLAGHPAFDRLIREHQAWLAERGKLVIGSGSFRSGRLVGAIHTDFGPENQDKETNQDYVAAWLPHDEAMQKRFRCILAMGDGLTTSFRSEWASAMACLVALRTLAEGDPSGQPKDLVQHAFDEAGGGLGRLADELSRDPEASCPPGQFISTWKYILKKGTLFQTTLTLAWLDHEFFRIATVGDGGALWRDRSAPLNAEQATDRVLAECDLDCHQVCALGPADRNVRAFDCWREEKLGGSFLCALHTDGIGRGVGGNPTTFLDELELLQAAGEENPPRRFIEQAVERRPQDFDDNLTLAVIRDE
jgi:hypothetical protein